MPEARSYRVSSQRFLSALRLAAVALCATAFLLPGANAAEAAKKAHVAKKSSVSVDSKRKAAPSATASKRSASSKQAEATGNADRTVSGGRNVVASIHQKNGRTVVAVQRRSIVRVAEGPAKQSFGQLAGLHSTEDPLDLKSSVALVIDQDTREVLFSKNDHAVLPIASLTKQIGRAHV